MVHPNNAKERLQLYKMSFLSAEHAREKFT